jgi:hypothetical protein
LKFKGQGHIIVDERLKETYELLSNSNYLRGTIVRQKLIIYNLPAENILALKNSKIISKQFFYFMTHDFHCNIQYEFLTVVAKSLSLQANSVVQNKHARART